MVGVPALAWWAGAVLADRLADLRMCAQPADQRRPEQERDEQRGQRRHAVRKVM